MTFSSRKTLIALVLSVLVVGAGPMLAAAATAPTVDSSSDLDEGVTVSITNASAEQTQQLVVNTDNAEDIESADVEIIHENRNTTHYTADDSSDEYSLEADVDTSGDGSADSDQHTWNISHDEFEDVPMGIDETVDMNVTVTVEDANGDTAETQFTFQLSNSDERSVVYVNSDSIDDEDVGPEAESDTDEVSDGWFGTEEIDVYHLDTERAVNGSATDVHYYIADSDAQDAFDDRAEDAESGDIIHAMTHTHDGHVTLVFYEEADEDVVDVDNDTYAVYEDGGYMTLHLGDDYEDSIAVKTHVGSHVPTYLDSISGDDVASTYEATDFGFGDLPRSFSGDALTFTFGDAWDIANFQLLDFDVWDDDDDEDDSFVPLLVVGGAGAARAKQTAEA